MFHLPPTHSRTLLVVGDRVLIKLETGEERTDSGLILPQTVAEKAQVQTGWVTAIGPGSPLPMLDDEDEPWRQTPQRPRYLPMQPKIGDYAIFLRKAAVEINYKNEIYLIVPQAAILALLRDENEDDEIDDVFGQERS